MRVIAPWNLDPTCSHFVQGSTVGQGARERQGNPRCLSVLDTLSLLQPTLYPFAVAPAFKERNASIVSEWLLGLC
jgi:hypothetical protein